MDEKIRYRIREIFCSVVVKYKDKNIRAADRLEIMPSLQEFQETIGNLLV